MDLESFDISSQTGFLPNNPVQALQGNFSEWERFVQRLHHEIHNKCVKRSIEDLPEIEFSDKTLSTEEEWQRAYVILSFIAQAFIYEMGDVSGSPVKLPSKVAIQLCRTAEHIGVPPVATYAAVVLYNYALKDRDKPLNADNLKAALTFTGSTEESWFFMVHALEEIDASRGLQSIKLAYDAMTTNDNETLRKNLKEIIVTLHNMKTSLGEMRRKCSPQFFYNDLRPFLGLPECGVIYDGVSSEVKLYRSGSGAQDSAIPAFNNFLGIEHGNKEQDELNDFMIYMPAKHRRFLIALRSQPSVKLYVRKSGDAELIKCYDEAVLALYTFRCEHIQLVTSYIINPKSHNGEETTETDKGTGGTKFMEFLKNVKDNTR